MNNLKCFLLLFLLAQLLGCNFSKSERNRDKIQQQVSNKLSGDFSISGAYALSPLVRKWATDFCKSNPGVNINITAGVTGQGITDLLEKKIELAMISRPLSDVELNAGIWVVPVARDGVAPIINRNNPYIDIILKQGLSPDEFLKIFTSDKKITWGELLDTVADDVVVVYTREDESGAASVFGEFIFKNASDLKGIKVKGDEEMIGYIQRNKLAIGFCNLSYAFDSSSGERTRDIQIIPSDLDYDNSVDRKEEQFVTLEKAHRSIWLGLYPKNLCRDLMIGALGKPTDEAILAFLRYILTEGQKDVKGSGLCELNGAYVKFSLDKLE